MTPLDLICPTAGSPAPYPLIDASGRYTFEELMARARAVGHELRALSDNAQKARCIVSLDKGPDFFAGLVGCWMSGRLPVLLDPMVRTELKEAAQLTQASSAVVSKARCAALPSGVSGVVPGGASNEPLEIASSDQDAVVLYLFTSGSTGKPTLVPKRFSQISVEVDFISSLFGGPRRVAGLIPWCHIWGLLSSFFVPLKMGGVCDLRGGISARDVLSLVGEQALDLVAAVPVYYQAMVKLMSAGVVTIPSTACRFASSSAPLSPALRDEFRRLLGCGITDIYGSTEAGGIAFRHNDGPWIPEPHVEIRIDGDGMLDVRSPSVSFETQDGFFRTGDLVREEGQGFVLIGRGDDVVKIGGRRLSLEEIRRQIESMPNVAKAVVLTEKVSGTLRLVAFVETDDETLRPADVKAYVRGRLADHKVPRSVRLRGSLPMTPSGKVDRQLLLTKTNDEGNT